MPEYSQICSNDAYTESVTGSKGETYDVHVWRTSEGATVGKCDCKGFEFRGRCKHIDSLRENLCDWTEAAGPEKQTPQQEMEAVCPRCGSETKVVT